MALAPRIDRSVVKVPPRPREGMSKDHLRDVKSLPCLICGSLRNMDPHHLLRGLPPTERGMGRKAADKYAVPACRTHHDAMHAAGDDEAWLTERGIDGRGIALSLWSKRGDLPAMLRIVARSLNARGVYVA